MTSLSRVKTSTTAVGCCGHRTASKRANPAIREIFSLRQHPREFNICSPSPEATIALSRGPLCHYMKVAARRQHKSQFHFFFFFVFNRLVLLVEMWQRGVDLKSRDFKFAALFVMKRVIIWKLATQHLPFLSFLGVEFISRKLGNVPASGVSN